MNKLFFGILAALMLASCTGGGGSEKPQTIDAKGPVNYGGVFNVNEVEAFKDLYPLNITEVSSHRIANQVYEGLVKLNQKNLKVVPGIAKSWEKNDDATKFTFHLRKGVMFHKDKCFDNKEQRKVTAEDVKYCFNKLCEASSRNQLYWLFKDKVVGANEYHKSTEKGEPLEGGVKGVKVIDDHTVEINLKYPFSGFEKILAHPGCYIWPKEALDEYGVEMRVNAVGTGPFRLKKVEEDNFVILERNPNYYRTDEYGNQLPYMDAIKVSFVKEKKAELMQFRKKNLDMVFKLPVEMIGEVTGELREAREKKNKELPFKMQTTPSLAIQYYGFQHKSDLFSDVNVRKAFNYAVNREQITKFTLQGEGIPAHHGIIPPSFEDYPTEDVKGYSFNPEKARKHLAEAGYKNGEGFPELKLQLNSGGSTNVQVAEAIQKMLQENLGIEVELDVLPFAQHLERIEGGKTKFWRAGWLADYPSPENFLNLLYGDHVPESMDKKSFINSMRYQSAEFDSLFQKALKTTDDKERMELFMKADQVAMEDAAIIPLYYDENIRLIQPNVKNFPVNPMEYRDFTKVYLEKEEKEES